jgi:hypothetical protein
MERACAIVKDTTLFLSLVLIVVLGVPVVKKMRAYVISFVLDTLTPGIQRYLLTEVAS